MTLGRARRPRSPASAAVADVAPRGRTVPYDHSFVFPFGDTIGETQRRTIRVSVEAPFVAVSIGYGLTPSFEPFRFGLRLTDRERDDDEPPPEPPRLEDVLGAIRVPRGAAIALAEIDRPPLVTSFTAADIRLVNIIAGLQTAIREREAVFRRTLPTLDATTFRIRREFAELLSFGDGTEQIDLDEATAAELFETVHTPIEDVQFRYALFDEASGREFQSGPILSTAGLGTATGDRPFRYFAKPIRFAPQSAIRLEVTQVTPFVGELHVALHGYKVVGGGAAVMRRAARQRRLTRRRR